MSDATTHDFVKSSAWDKCAQCGKSREEHRAPQPLPQGAPDLLPCFVPGCGGPPYKFTYEAGGMDDYGIRCGSCSVAVTSPYESQSIAAWNRRPTPQAAVPAMGVADLAKAYWQSGAAAAQIHWPKATPVLWEEVSAGDRAFMADAAKGLMRLAAPQPSPSALVERKWPDEVLYLGKEIRDFTELLARYQSAHEDAEIEGCECHMCKRYEKLPWDLFLPPSDDPYHRGMEAARRNKALGLSTPSLAAPAPRPMELRAEVRKIASRATLVISDEYGSFVEYPFLPSDSPEPMKSPTESTLSSPRKDLPMNESKGGSAKGVTEPQAALIREALAEIEAWDKDESQGAGEAVGLVCMVRDLLEDLLGARAPAERSDAEQGARP